MIPTITTSLLILILSIAFILISNKVPYNIEIIFKASSFGIYSILHLKVIQKYSNSLALSIITLFASYIILANFSFAFLLVLLFILVFSFLLRKEILDFIFKQKLKNYFILIIISLLLSISIFEQLSENITDPFIEMKLKQFILNPDTLFHASVAEMIKNYGKASTGLHGLPTIHYHILSHFLYAKTASILEQKSVIVYGFCNYLVFAPIFVYVFLNLINKFTKLSKLNKYSILIISVFISFSFSRNFGHGYANLSSESYLIGLTLFGVVIDYLYFDLNKKNIYLKIFISSIILLLTPIAKISLGLISIFLVNIYILANKKISFTNKSIHLIFNSIAWYIGHNFARTINIPGLELKFEWMFYRNVLYPDYTFFQFIFSHFNFAWFAISILITKIFLSKHKKILYYIEFISLLFLLTIGFAGLNIVIDSSGYYFSNPSYFFAGFIILKNLNYLPKITLESKYNLFQIIVLFTIIFCLILTSNYYLSTIPFSIHKIRKIRSEVYLNSNYKNIYIDYLKQIYEEDKNYMVYIPKSETEFWDNIDDKISPWNSLEYQCIKMPFHIPLLSGKPAIFGLPHNRADRSCLIFFRGYETYSKEEFEVSSIKLIDKENICKMVKIKKFKGYFQITKNGYEKIDCN
jgi:hypothetical protein